MQSTILILGLVFAGVPACDVLVKWFCALAKWLYKSFHPVKGPPKLDQKPPDDRQEIATETRSKESLILAAQETGKEIVQTDGPTEVANPPKKKNRGFDKRSPPRKRKCKRKGKH